MKLIVEKTEELKGEITIPSSKSHTIRAVIFTSLADGTSKIKNPLLLFNNKEFITVDEAPE